MLTRDPLVGRRPTTSHPLNHTGITNHESQITNHKSQMIGGPPGDRTRDTLIKSQVLYH